MFFRIRFLLSVLLVLSVSALFAQTGNIRGFVFDEETGEPVIFTNVYLKGTTYGSATDVNGYYSISKIPPGEYMLTVTYLGYDTIRLAVKIAANDIITQKLVLKKSGIQLKSIEVSAERQEAKTEIRTSLTKITPKEIKQVPTLGGEADLAQYLQILPGVVFTGDQGGQLFIRGGSPIQNLVLLDGMVVYNPFHSIGFFSVFDTDILRNVDIYTGGFNSEYGGRISSVIDITTRDGNKKRYSGKVSLNPFTSKINLEGPIKRAKDEADGSSSILLSYRTSYLDKSSKIFYTYVDSSGLPYNFDDFYGKVSFNSATGSKLNVFGFNFGDRVNFTNLSKLKWDAKGFGSNFVIMPSGTAVLIGGNFAYSQYGMVLTEADNRPRESKINGFNTGIDFTYLLGKNEIKYGIEMLGFRTDFNFINPLNRKIEQVENTTEIAAFMKYKFILGKLLMEPSFRAHYYGSLGEFSPEPRLGLKILLTDYLRFKMSGGFYTQNLLSATSDRDVVNLFYGFLSGPDNLPEKFNGKEVTTKLQKAQHAIAGFEIDLPHNFDLNIEGYYKNFSQLTNINRDKLFDDTPENSLKPDLLKKDFIIENGNARGLDFLLKYDYKRWYVWGGYSVGFVNRFDGVRKYVPHFDRRHNVNVVLSHIFGKDLNWEADVRWNYGSGFPFTKTAGFYEYLNFSEGLNTDYTTSNGQLGIILGEINDGRLPSYHRLDATVKRKFEFAKNVSMEANAGVTNIYNRENIFYYDRVRATRVNQLPVLPSAGLILSF